MGSSSLVIARSFKWVDDKIVWLTLKSRYIVQFVPNGGGFAKKFSECPHLSFRMKLQIFGALNFSLRDELPRT
jgi:hypothetical protein